MIYMMIYEREEKAHLMLKSKVKDIAARETDDLWHIVEANEEQAIEKYFVQGDALDLSCCDLEEGRALKVAERLRAAYQEMIMMVIASASLSPLCYVKPAVLPAVLLLKPFTREQAGQALQELISYYLQKKEDENGKSAYVIANREGRISISYGRIAYFEAREKKIFVQTDNAEYGFYETIERLAEQLPARFVRCHRSFIVNVDKIEKLLFSQNLILLEGDMYVPLSRSYKPALKDVCR